MKNLPELRFAGFDGEWEECSLCTIVKINSGRDYKHLEEGIYPVYGTGGLITYVNEFLSDVDSIGIGRKGTINKPQKLEAPFWTVDTLFYSTPIKGNNLDYIYSVFQRINWLKYDESTGLPSLSKTNINNIRIYTSEVQEQEKIGDLFRKLDDLTEIQEGKVSKMRDYKKSMLQKMFPKKDELVPEFRFDGFDGEWKIKKIEDLASVKTGKSDTKDADDNGIYPFYIRSDKPVRSSKYLYDEEAVLTIGDGQIGRVFFYVNGKYDLHQRVYRIFDFTDDIDSKYFYHYFSKFFLRRAMRLSAKGTVDSVRMEMITGMEIKTPKSKEEQIKIRSFLENLDTQIENEEKLLESYKCMKKSLLQKMFV